MTTPSPPKPWERAGMTGSSTSKPPIILLDTQINHQTLTNRHSNSPSHKLNTDGINANVDILVPTPSPSPATLYPQYRRQSNGL